MKATYNRSDDILMLELSSASIDHAEECGPFLLHFSPQGELVLVELSEASVCLGKMVQTAEGKTAEL